MEFRLLRSSRPIQEEDEWLRSPQIEALNASKYRIATAVAMLGRHAWVSASRRSNPNEHLVAACAERIGRPLVSRAEAKMFEILDFYPCLLHAMNSTRSAKVLHLADAPGGFASAVTDACKRKGVVHGGWVGVTLRSDHDCDNEWEANVPVAKTSVNDGTNIAFDAPERKRARTNPESALITEAGGRSGKGNRNGALLYHPRVAHTGTVLWGPTGTGDLTDERNVRAFCSAPHAGAYALVTADGGFDVSEDPGLQEERSAALIAAEVRIALAACAEGGCAVIKFFACTTPEMRRALAALVSGFASVRLFKPRNSRPCNSERYAVCLARHGSETEIGATTKGAGSCVEGGVAVEIVVLNMPRGLDAAENALAARQTQAIERVLRDMGLQHDLGDTKHHSACKKYAPP